MPVSHLLDKSIEQTNELGILSFHKPQEDNGWSEENDQMIESSSKSHFIDVASRRYCLEALKPILCKPEVRYCDFGCSTGWLIEDVMRLFPKVTILGSDYFQSGLLKLRKRLKKIPLLQFDVCRIPFHDQTLDVFSCLNVLEHVKDDQKALSELKRVLKPKGRGFIMAPASPALFDYYDEVHLHHRRYTKNDLRNKINKAGFEIIHINYLATILYWPFFIVKKYKNHQLRNKSVDEKRLVVEQEIKTTQESSFSSAVSRSLELERHVGRYLPFPFGIRLCAVVTIRQ